MAEFAILIYFSVGVGAAAAIRWRWADWFSCFSVLVAWPVLVGIMIGHISEDRRERDILSGRPPAPQIKEPK
jgi:hypothetical protein